ncbi:MAG: two-component regulator propeller domain-containing protein [Bacteroides sp.]|nr:two-component regulator propeller domain-containing protein [Bacteroides sp.]
MRNSSFVLVRLLYPVFLIFLLGAGACTHAGQSSSTPTVITSPIITNDLSNQKVTSFAEDAQGHIWIGTFRGLNKFNVHEYHQYYCTDDSLDLPDNQINDLLCDSKGRLWVVTVNGVCIYTDEDNFRYIPIDFPNKNGWQIIENKEGRIFLNLGLHLAAYNSAEQKFDILIQDFDPMQTLNQRCFISPDNKLWAVNPLYMRCYNSSTLALEDSIPLNTNPDYFFMQSNGNIWLTGNRQVHIFDTQSRKFKETPRAILEHPRLKQARVSYIHPYGHNGLLLNTDKHGLFLYNYIEGSVIHQDESGFPFEAPDFQISTMFTDSQKNLWIGSIDQGCTVRYNYKERFNTNNYLSLCLKNKSVKSVAVDKERNLWIATLVDGLYTYNMDSREVKKVDMQQVFRQAGIDYADFTLVFVDDENNIWLGAAYYSKVLKCRYRNGILQVENCYDIFAPMSFAQDHHGTLWIGTSSHTLWAMKKGEKEFTKVQAFPQIWTFIPGLLPIDNDKMWATAFMCPIMQIDQTTWEAKEVPFDPADWKACIKRSVFIPTAIMRDSRGDIWIGTVSNGLLHYTTATGQLKSMEGIPCQDISSIEEDAQGNIWIGTQYGLSKYDHTVDRFTNYYAADGTGGNQFYDRSSCRLPDGTLVFGGTHGLTYFNPIDVSIKRNIPLLFEDLKIHNRLVRPQADGNIEKHLSYHPDIRLNHDENGFSISFAALDYCEYERVHYYYMMEGFDKYWIDANNNREAYYANLPAGCYTFKVKITNNDKSIVETENSIRVIVRPAPWATWWARCLYLLVTAVLIGFLIRVRLRIRRSKEAIRRARQEKEQEQRVNRMNMSFFANISHEFRTPLTMISGPVAQLCESPQIEGADKQLLYIVQRSVGRMLRLVNQLMDFNKLENDTLKLQVRRTDIISQLQRFVDIFRINATEKGIELNTYGLEDTFLMWLDADKLDKIVGNLLSNALKFTPGGGRVELSFDVITREEATSLFPSTTESLDKQYVKIVVADTGCGIPQDQLEKVFERYYQLNNQHTGTYNWGTGIGLYYARSLAVLHHGLLCASNRAEGTGAVFTLLLPTTDAAYTAEERTLPDEEQNKAFPLQTEAQYRSGQAEGNPQEKQTILITDDDTEVVHYLKALLSPYYRTICRFDADSAFKAMSEEAPDLVLSDVIMPGKSGYELCRQIKDDLQLCHIPVILVTAKATVENQVEGLDTGADAYVTKPFDPSYLLALIKSLLKNREKVRSLLSQSTQTDKIEENVLSPQDNAFMTDLYRLMENELSNPELDVARMTELLRISRTKFYYKVKGLTGENPSVFFKTYKLNRAAELIKEGKYTVSEIADMTGFSTLSHFSTSFKKQFGVAPSEYKG